MRKVWSADAGTGSSSSGRLSAVPLVADGKVFTLDAGGTVSAFSSASGAKLWTTSVTPDNEKSKEGFGGGLALDGGHLYAATGYGTVVSIDAGNGAILWTKRIGKPIRSSPTAAGGKIYFVSADNMLYALSDADGQQLWTSRGLPQPATLLSNVSPAVSGNIVVAPFPAGDVAAFDVSSGKAAWSNSLSRSSETTAAGILGDPARPVIDRGVVFAVSHGGKMIAIVGILGRAAVDAKSRQHADAVDRWRHRLCRRPRRQARCARPRRRQGAVGGRAPRQHAMERAGAGRRQAVAGVREWAFGRRRCAGRAR